MRKTLAERFKSDPISHLIAVLALLAGLMFILMQGGKLLGPEAASAEMAHLPIGPFDWGFAWADTFVPGPLLLIGGLCLLCGSHRLGHLLIFAGWTVNFYGMLVFFAGYRAIGQPQTGSALVEIVATAFVSLLCMAWSVVATVRDHRIVG